MIMIMIMMMMMMMMILIAIVASSTMAFNQIAYLPAGVFTNLASLTGLFVILHLRVSIYDVFRLFRYHFFHVARFANSNPAFSALSLYNNLYTTILTLLYWGNSISII